jgi:hypothetical protein
LLLDSLQPYRNMFITLLVRVTFVIIWFKVPTVYMFKKIIKVHSLFFFHSFIKFLKVFNSYLRPDWEIVY